MPREDLMFPRDLYRALYGFYHLISPDANETARRLQMRLEHVRLRLPHAIDDATFDGKLRIETREKLFACSCRRRIISEDPGACRDDDREERVPLIVLSVSSKLLFREGNAHDARTITIFQCHQRQFA